MCGLQRWRVLLGGRKVVLSREHERGGVWYSQHVRIFNYMHNNFSKDSLQFGLEAEPRVNPA